MVLLELSAVLKKNYVSSLWVQREVRKSLSMSRNQKKLAELKVTRVANIEIPF